MKDVVIIRGRNYYPEDLERSAEHAHAAFRVGYCAAFSIEVEDRERLVIVQEIEPRHRDLDADAAIQAIRRVVATDHELEVYAIVLTKAGEVPKTSSGKTRRSACRDHYLNGELEVVARWTANGEALDDDASDAHTEPCQRLATSDEIEGWLIQRIAARLALPPTQVRVATPFLEFGMGSLDAVELAAELERWLGRRIAPTAIYNHPNIGALARWLASPPSTEESAAGLYHARISTEELHPDRLLDDVRNMTEEDIKAFLQEEMTKQQTGK